MSYVWDVFNTQPEFKGRSKSCRNSQTLAIKLCLDDGKQPTETKAFKIKTTRSTFNETFCFGDEEAQKVAPAPVCERQSKDRVSVHLQDALTSLKSRLNQCEKEESTEEQQTVSVSHLAAECATPRLISWFYSLLTNCLKLSLKEQGDRELREGGRRKIKNFVQ